MNIRQTLLHAIWFFSLCPQKLRIIMALPLTRMMYSRVHFKRIISVFSLFTEFTIMNRQNMSVMRFWFIRYSWLKFVCINLNILMLLGSWWVQPHLYALYEPKVSHYPLLLMLFETKMLNIIFGMHVLRMLLVRSILTLSGISNANLKRKC